MPTGHQLGPAQGERAAHIAPPSFRGEFGLRTGSERSREHVRAHRDPPRVADAAGQEESLVEPTLTLPSRMERDRRQQIRSAGWKPIRGDLGDKVSQRGGQRAAATELQGMHGLTRDLAVADGRPGIGERGRPAPAETAEVPSAECRGDFERRQPDEGQAAHPAVRWGDAIETLPADAAEWISPAFPEAPLADRTERRKDEIQQRGDPGPPARPNGRGRPYGRDVFQRRHEGQRSNHDGWVAPHATQR